MKRLFCFFQAFFSAFASASDYPETGINGMLGFAKKGNTTGGTGGPIFHINTLEELTRHMTDSVAKILVINSNIVTSKKTEITLGSNKSLIGSWKANIIDNVYFKTDQKSNNIIFQNVLFKHSTSNIKNGDTQLILDYGNQYWIDHCTFDGTEVNENDLGKLLKVSRKADYVTISNSKFMNHEYGLILGFPSNISNVDMQYDNYPQITIMFNYFDNVKTRAPGLMRYGKFHVYNNYITNYHLGFTIATEAKIYSEYNYFTAPTEGNAVLDDKGTGYFTDVGSTNMVDDQISGATTWNPASDYSYDVNTPDYSREFCIKYSGAQSTEWVFGS